MINTIISLTFISHIGHPFIYGYDIIKNMIRLPVTKRYIYMTVLRKKSKQTIIITFF